MHDLLVVDEQHVVLVPGVGHGLFRHHFSRKHHGLVIHVFPGWKHDGFLGNVPAVHPSGVRSHNRVEEHFFARTIVHSQRRQYPRDGFAVSIVPPLHSALSGWMKQNVKNYWKA
jgi:hypothetical protein